jgi:hypothetical protein
MSDLPQTLQPTTVLDRTEREPLDDKLAGQSPLGICVTVPHKDGPAIHSSPRSGSTGRLCRHQRKNECDRPVLAAERGSYAGQQSGGHGFGESVDRRSRQFVRGGASPTGPGLPPRNRVDSDGTANSVEAGNCIALVTALGL